MSVQRRITHPAQALIIRELRAILAILDPPLQRCPICNCPAGGHRRLPGDSRIAVLCTNEKVRLP